VDLLVGMTSSVSGKSIGSVKEPFVNVKAMWKGGLGAGSSSWGAGAAATKPARAANEASLRSCMAVEEI